MATPEKKRPTTLDEAFAQLKRDPSHPVVARVDDLDVELRAVTPAPERTGPGLGDLMAAIGPWKGESTEEILEILRQGRESSRRTEQASDK